MQAPEWHGVKDPAPGSDNENEEALSLEPEGWVGDTQYTVR
jgi:hypothetical protein